MEVDERSRRIAQYWRRKTRSEVGWIYDELPWLTEDEALKANQERETLMNDVLSCTRQSFAGTALHTGELSPGCRLCGEGLWSCLFVNHNCNGKCFFCPQDRNSTAEHPPRHHTGIEFDSADDYVDFLEAFGYKGVGFSGGECLLQMDRVIEYLEMIGSRLGESYYTWLYTNGTFVTEEKLARLQAAGLKEIRFNIRAFDYSLDSLALARDRFDMLTVEIPVIPEEEETLTGLLGKLDKLGVNHLHLHQLVATESNYKELNARGYTLLHHPGLSVPDSEMAALRILRHGAESGLGMSLHYCPTIYKDRLQSRADRLRSASIISRESDTVTQAGYLRQLRLSAAPDRIVQITEGLQSEGYAPELWHIEDNGCSLLVSETLYEHLAQTHLPVAVDYFEYSQHSEEKREDEDLSLAVNDGLHVAIRRRRMGGTGLLKGEELRAFIRLYLEGDPPDRVFSELMMQASLDDRDSLLRLQEKIQRIGAVEAFEFLEQGMPEWV